MGSGRLKPSSPRDRGVPVRTLSTSTPDAATPSQQQQYSASAVTIESCLERSTDPLIPSESFLCPIHLEIMADPVTLHTGMTYDRVSIHTWLTAGHNTCPVTNQPLLHHNLIPNHALRRAILTWTCAANRPAAAVNPRDPPCEIIIPTPPVDQLLHELTTLLHNIANCNTIYNHVDLSSSLQHLSTVLPQLDDDNKRALFGDPNICNSSTLAAQLATQLCHLLSSNSTSISIKVNAAEILHTLCEQSDSVHVGAHPGAIKGVATLLKEESLTSTSDVTACLKCLLSLCKCKKNRIPNRIVAIECDVVSVLMDLMMIPQTENMNRSGRQLAFYKPNVEFCCGILEALAACAEGREAIGKHPSGVVRMVESLLGVSDVATEYSVGALYGVLALAADRRSVMNVAMEADVFKKLLMVMSSDCSQRAKGKAKEMLKMLNEECGGSNYIPRSVIYVAAAHDFKRRRDNSGDNDDSFRSSVID